MSKNQMAFFLAIRKKKRQPDSIFSVPTGTTTEIKTNEIGVLFLVTGSCNERNIWLLIKNGL